MINRDHLAEIFSSVWLRGALGCIMLAILVALIMPLSAAVSDYSIAQEPLYGKQSQPPLMMMVMSRDEQLFNKAYSDYSDLNGDGVLDTSYLDAFDYGGYFDSNLCYSYSSNQFKASAKAVGGNKHSCSSQWSGNFLNWIAMSRIDVMRQVLYGGQRSTDSLTSTVLERAQIPNDLHAWVKVYAGSDISSFAPLSGTQSFCNASFGASGLPLMQVASGNWSEWASTALSQCGTSQNGGDKPTGATNFNVRVEVCASVNGSLNESFCRKYNDGKVDRYKPVGVLQNYGETGRLRFGLISGTYVNPRSGGVLRKNIGKIAGNGTAFCGTGDEIDLSTGQFCYLKDTQRDREGVINTISAFKIDQWNWRDNWSDCNTYSILNRQGQGGQGNLNDPGTGGQKCSAWGNPLAEMYAEALRYVTAGTKRYDDTGDLSGLPKGISWSDPYRTPENGGNSYCATCNILVLSSGLPSFDSDDIGDIVGLRSATGSTDEVGTAEGFVGKSYTAGRIGATPLYASLNTHEDICQARTIGSFSDVRGICPDIPSMEGSFMIAGLAKAAADTDLRPKLQGKPDSYKVTATTYSVAMAENLPTFEIRLADRRIGLSPLCQANNSGAATAPTPGWRSCFLGAVGIGTKTSAVGSRFVYGRPYRADGSAGSFSLVWEDSLWGNDHDNDVVAMLSYCVGAACSQAAGFQNICWRADTARSVSAANAGARVCTAAGTVNGTVADDEVMIRIENLSAYAGNAMLTGYTITGSNASSPVQRLTRRPGNADGSLLSGTESISSWDSAVVIKYKASGAGAGQFESPLWYAAKYGVPAGKQWDSKKAGTPDNYFLARNPAALKTALEEIFSSAAEGDAPVSGGGSGARISTGSFTVSSRYSVPSGSYDWTGDVIATRVTADGSDGGELWRASSRIAVGNRRIYMATAPTSTKDSDGTVTAATVAEFTSTNIPGADRAAQLGVLGFSGSVPAWFGNTRTVAELVSYLRGAPIAGLRSRSSPLGDIVNSNTEIVSNRDDYGYGAWASSDAEWKKTIGAAYASYLSVKRGAGGPPTMVYVGANDGMLHGFNASSSISSGNEELAFIPSTSLQYIAELANPKYTHRYYVDGQLTSSDVYYGGVWNTVLVGATGAGGSLRSPNSSSAGNGSVFALNVGAPTSFDEDNVLWEVSGKTEPDLGFVLGKPVIVPVPGTAANGAPRFVALFGNGVNSSTGKPVLFVVDVQTGKVIRRLSPSAATYSTRNGLINIVPVALGSADGIADTVYGGDLQGNLWKFDLSANDVSKWTVALNGTPLFTAIRDNSPQPITSGIEIVSGPGNGVSLFFGTGRYFAVDDNDVGSKPPVQSLYGIWDNLSTPVGGRSNLVQQNISTGLSSNGYQIRDVTRNAVNYVDKRGWYVDLAVGTANGERFIGNPTIQNGSVFFTTYVPGSAICGAGGGTNWLYGLNLLSGGGAMTGLSPVVNGKELCSGNCGGIALTKGGAGPANGPPIKDTSIFVPKLSSCTPGDASCTVDKLIQAEQCTFVLRAPGADPLYMPRPCGRQSWRQIR
ncbi:type IV pilus assembly protein PilY1 [Xanthomonas arboricola]|uniref:pilus assembly protein n=1 Tax=Xanthomonas euroxanthea TaxID=2259622 RepID=UPI0016B5CB84|nr:PilC/PilY family type IV pilus protein [Xanthomonas euroxanthea]NJC38239.1 type IV pilus assembly protein PilY1 [Xanthomonas euroxanthea]